MSTLKTNTIQHLTSGFNNVVAHTDGAGTANAVHCRGWVNFDGTGTVTIRASFNVSSITDNNTGSYTVNFSNAMPDANYSVSFTPLRSLSDLGTQGCGSLRSGARSTTTCILGTTDMNDTVFQDAVDVNVTVFR